MFNNGNNATGMYMPVAPAAYGGYGNGGLLGGDGLWVLILIIAILSGGWGGMGGFGWGGGMMGLGMADGLGLYPWLNNSQNINGGFRDQQISTQLSAIQQGQTAGFGDVQLGIAGVNQNICQTGNGIITALNGNQMALLQQLFGIQLAQQQGTCENRAATADLKYTVAAEAAASRAAGTADTQKILDKLCQLELDNERAQRAADQREITRLNSELMYARGQASQIDQTARLEAANAAALENFYTRLKNCPVNAVPVYGNVPIFTCPTNNGNNCGRGGNAVGLVG